MCSAIIYYREIIRRLGRKGISAQAPTGQTGLGLAGVRTPLSLNVLQLETNEKINPFTSKLFQEISSVIQTLTIFNRTSCCLERIGVAHLYPEFILWSTSLCPVTT